jgi:uncharacterized protein YbcI
MNEVDSTITAQLAQMASRFQEQRTGRRPTAATAVLSEDTLVVTLNGALTPAEQALSQTPQGAAQVQEFHRQLFAGSTTEMRQEISRLTGRRVKEAAAELDPATGSVIHAFSTGDMVQVFLLSPAETPNADGLTPMQP